MSSKEEIVMRARYGIFLIVLTFITALSTRTSALVIQSSNMNIYNGVSGEGPTGEFPVGYGFEVFVTTEEDPGVVSTDDVIVTVDGVPLPITGIGPGWWSPFSIIATGRFAEDETTEPVLGDYEVSVKGSPPAYVGNLQDIPKDAPEMLYPQHQQVIADTTPTFEWEAFTSDYLGELVPSSGYELELSFPDRTHLVTYVGDQTSLDYLTATWDIDPPERLPPGLYGVTLHSGHGVASSFTFEHHRRIRFEVAPEPIPEPSTTMLLTTGLGGIAAYGFRRKRKA
jgi:hypothetical protein